MHIIYCAMFSTRVFLTLHSYYLHSYTKNREGLRRIASIYTKIMCLTSSEPVVFCSHCENTDREVEEGTRKLQTPSAWVRLPVGEMQELKKWTYRQQTRTDIPQNQVNLWANDCQQYVSNTAQWQCHCHPLSWSSISSSLILRLTLTTK